MWFSLPKGTTGLTVEQQQFSQEITDKDGVSYFRAPDHFSPRILALPGFALAEPPDGAPADLPKSDPLRDGAISELTQTLAAQKIEIQNLRSDLNAAHASVTSLHNAKTALEQKLRESTDKIEDLQEQLEDKPVAIIPMGKTK